MKDSHIYVTFSFIAAILVIVGIAKDNVPIVLLSLTGIIVCIILANKSRKKESKSAENSSIEIIDKLLKDNNLISSHFYLNYNNTQAINIDEENKILAIIEKYGSKFTVKKFNFNQLIESEIIQDGVTVNKTSRGSQIGGALIGGAVAGGLGAVVGGLSGKSKSHEEFKKIQLQISFDDLNIPLKNIEFIQSDYPIEKHSPTYKDVYDKVLHWHKMISILIKREQENKVISNH